MSDSPDRGKGGRWPMSFARRLLDWCWPLSVLLLVVLVWDRYVAWGRIPVDVLPSPLATVNATIANAATLWSNTKVTAFEIIAGFVASAAIGIPLALLIDRFKRLEGFLYPYLVATQVV